MAKGELSLADPSTTPALLNDWLVEHKYREIRKWIDENFIPEPEFNYDFSDWENEDDLNDDDQLDDTSTRSILLGHFGLVLNAVEFEKILELLDEEFTDAWKPSEDRIDVDEVDDDDELEFLSFSDVRESIPALLRHVSEVREALFPHLGHNNPPVGLEITGLDFEQFNALLLSASAFDEEPSSSELMLLDQLGEAALRIGGEIVRYVANKGDLFLGKAVEAAGEATGKWAVRAIAIYFAGSAFRDFGRALLDLLAK